MAQLDERIFKWFGCSPVNSSIIIKRISNWPFVHPYELSRDNLQYYLRQVFEPKPPEGIYPVRILLQNHRTEFSWRCSVNPSLAGWVLAHSTYVTYFTDRSMNKDHSIFSFFCTTCFISYMYIPVGEVQLSVLHF